MIRIEAEIPRDDLMAVSDALRIIDVGINISKVKSRGESVGPKIHASKGTEIFRSEFRDKYILQVTVTDNNENDVVEIIKSNSKTGKITVYPVTRVIDIGSSVENNQALALNEYDSVILTAAKNQNTSFPFGLASEKIKYQPPVIDGEKGYYDILEKKFIPLNELESVICHVKPEKKYQIFSPNDPVIIESKNRSRRNFSLYKMKLSDSYSQAFLKYVAHRFLSLWPEQEINTAVLFVDIVGSTRLATQLSSEELSGMMKVFSEEMSVIISKHAGFVLKYTGDAVIAFFPELKEFGNMVENAIRCANSMNMIVKYALNPTFENFKLPTINVRMDIDAGKNRIVFFGSDPDLIGQGITIASKVLPFAQPYQIAIGDEAYKMISGETAKQFTRISSDDKKWSYTHPSTGDIYPIYFSKIPLIEMSNTKN